MLKFIKRISRIILFLICLVLIINFIPPKDAISINPFQNTAKISMLVSSQSGCGSQYPENVMASFNAASSYGVMYFSIGIVMTSDEQLLIADVDDLSAYTNRTGKISETTYADIKDINFAYNFKDESDSYPYRSQTLRCLTIETLFESFPYSNFIIKINMDEESSERAAILLCEKIRQYNLSTRVAIMGNETVTNYVRKQTNVNLLTAPINNELANYDHFQKIYLGNLYVNLDFQYVEISLEDIGLYSQSLINSLQNRNVSIFLTGVNTKTDYELAKQLGVDGVISDDPELIVELIATDAQLITDQEPPQETDVE